MNDATLPPPEYVPSVAEYVAGFKNIEATMTDKQRLMLCKHYASPARITTARDLSLAVGYQDPAANVHYGKLGQMLAGGMGLNEYPAVAMLVLSVEPDVASNARWLWVMRENVALALEELGWVKKNSDRF